MGIRAKWAIAKFHGVNQNRLLVCGRGRCEACSSLSEDSGQRKSAALRRGQSHSLSHFWNGNSQNAELSFVTITGAVWKVATVFGSLIHGVNCARIKSEGRGISNHSTSSAVPTVGCSLLRWCSARGTWWRSTYHGKSRGSSCGQVDR